MKKILFLLLLLSRLPFTVKAQWKEHPTFNTIQTDCSTILTAQTEYSTSNTVPTGRFTFAISAGTGFPINRLTSASYTWQILSYYAINQRFFVGAGTGLAFHEKALIPLFADVKFMLTKSGKFTPYMEDSFGYSFAPDKNANGGFYTNPSVGIHYSISGSKKLFLAFGYEFQQSERLRKQEQPLFKTEFAEKLKHHSISIKIGFLF